MNEHSGNLVPSQHDADQESAIEPVGSPEEFGFPVKPNAAQVRCWANQELFLDAWARTGSIGVGVPNAEYWGAKDTYGFKKRKAWALQAFMGKVEAEIDRRAIDGTDRPVIYKGEITTTYKEYSDNLLMFRAKKLDPSYRDNHDDRTRENIPAKTVINIIVPPGAEPPPQQVVEGEAKLVPEDESGADVS